MSGLDVKVYSTEKLADYCSSEHNYSYRAASNVVDAVEEVFDDEDLDVSASIGYATPQVPDYAIDGSGQTESVNQ